jgi:hypothetical protein
VDATDQLHAGVPKVVPVLPERSDVKVVRRGDSV